MALTEASVRYISLFSRDPTAPSDRQTFSEKMRSSGSSKILKLRRVNLVHTCHEKQADSNPPLIVHRRTPPPAVRQAGEL